MEKARFDALLARHGQALSLDRPSGVGTFGTAVSLRGKFMGAGADELVGAQGQTLRRCKIGNSEIAAAGWPGPPKIGDRLTDAAGRQWRVEDVDTRRDGETVWAHFLVVKG